MKLAAPEAPPQPHVAPSLGRPSMVRLALATVAAALITQVAWFTGDWWVDGYDGATRNLTIARIMLFAGLVAAFYVLPIVLRRVSRTGWLVFGGWTAYLAIWLAGMWPGIIMTDTAEVVSNARQGIVDEWFSYAQPLLHIAAMDLVPHMAVVGILQLLGTACLMAYLTTTMRNAGASWWAVVAINGLAAVSAPLVVNTLLGSRDTLYGLLHVGLALYLARAVLSRRSLSAPALAGVALLTGFLSVYRGDGIVLLLVIPLTLLLLRPSRRATLAGAGAFAAAAICFHVVLPAVLSVQERPHYYELSLRLNPLGAVLQTDFFSRDKEADLRELGRVVDVQAVRELSTPVEIPVYWENKWRLDASDADFDAFNRTADRLIRDNLVAALAGRVRTFGAATGLAPGSWTGTVMGSVEERDDWLKDKAGLEGAPLSEGLYDLEAKFIRASGEFRGVTLRGTALHWNLLPSLLLLIGVILAFRRLPFEALIAVIVLSRVPLIFAAAPAAQFKYYYAVHLGGIVVLGLLLARVHRDDLRRLWARRPFRPAVST